ncbi:hypothetical protein [Mycolicibacterium austroafricanum]|uniref:hypothetical protein n=1 Tax=Mycolicibacterium austroafricanum TaxID=39687 RepID=UPI001CA30647|nr:hypothetical protein [Mycolicibacterium austroafricanum]QZT60277.1 hypothetical protein JN085_14440 [Mycolicibacterium austroafricanum]
MAQACKLSIDLAFRPDSYFWPIGAEKQLLVHIKGAARRAAMKGLIDEGRFLEIPDFLAKAALSEDERTAIGRIHPRFMGGEYLPDQAEGTSRSRALKSTRRPMTSRASMHALMDLRPVTGWWTSMAARHSRAWLIVGLPNL